MGIWLERRGGEPRHASPSSAQGQGEWSHSTAPYAFMDRTETLLHFLEISISDTGGVFPVFLRPQC